MILKCSCAYQWVRNVSFSENFACILNRFIFNRRKFFRESTLLYMMLHLQALVLTLPLPTVTDIENSRRQMRHYPSKQWYHNDTSNIAYNSGSSRNGIEENVFSIFISVSFVNFEHILQLFLVFKTSGFSKVLAFKTTGWLHGRLSLYCATHSNDVSTKIVKANADLLSIFVSNAFNESVISGQISVCFEIGWC